MNKWSHFDWNEWTLFYLRNQSLLLFAPDYTAGIWLEQEYLQEVSTENLFRRANILMSLKDTLVTSLKLICLHVQLMNLLFYFFSSKNFIVEKWKIKPNYCIFIFEINKTLNRHILYKKALLQLFFFYHAFLSLYNTRVSHSL